MLSTNQKSCPVPERESYTLELITLDRKPGPPTYILKAILAPKCKYRWNPNSSSDPEFNLSAKLGNDNGSFIWGRSAFEHTGRNFSLHCESGIMACVLTGELMDIHGVYKEASINLDEKLKVEEYVDETTYETFHRLAERRPTPPENTNVVKLVELLKKNDPARQMVYYQTGVGTYAPPGMITSVGLKLAEKADEAAAWFLYQHVIDGYKYLMETYQIGDSISVFGFSRGAFTARALAGMLHCVGLLPKHNVEHVPFAYQVYAKAKDYNYESCGASKVNNSKRNRCYAWEVDPDDFKKTFCTSVKVDFVGVWDTVASVGALFPKTLPWIEYNPCIGTFRQALALDERRGNFIPSVWDHQHTNDSVQDIREVWFRGEHSDIGGGSAGPVTKPSKVRGQPDEVDHTMLSNITLRWMVRQIIECRTGILFDYTTVDKYRAMGILESPLPEDLESIEHFERY
ncbi:hypothetical protein BDV93DRAFT_558859 [Ceratobasidium sp. AG-I]|nr:hypothetical protein BDV93DRAFT_558859 [Ceratobasidium sp. AG-I]